MPLVLTRTRSTKGRKGRTLTKMTLHNKEIDKQRNIIFERSLKTLNMKCRMTLSPIDFSQKWLP